MGTGVQDILDLKDKLEAVNNSINKAKILKEEALKKKEEILKKHGVSTFEELVKEIDSRGKKIIEMKSRLLEFIENASKSLGVLEKEGII